MELNDLFGVLAVVIYLAGIGACTIRVILLHRAMWPGKPRPGMWLSILAAVYVTFVLFDAVGVVSVLSNSLNDIPPTSTARTAVLGAWLWALHGELIRLAKGSLK